MEQPPKAQSTEIMEMLSMSKKITEKEISDFLNEKKINFEKIEFVDIDEQTMNVRVTFKGDALTFTEIELLKGQAFPKHNNQSIRINFLSSSDGSLQLTKPNEDDKIEYACEYDKILLNEYERKLGSDEMVFLNNEVIDKQRAVAGYLIKNIGLNLIKGKSIMNVSLPINIFDTRSILELFAWQNAYASSLLELGGQSKSPLEKIKYTTAFAVTKFHLSGAQLKPFNPILGETFQCKIQDSMVYCEQTCHHPPIMNFYGSGKNFKFYGHNESEASTGANSVKVYYKGNFIVVYPDGTKHKIIYPNMKLTGTMMGSRSLKFRGKLFILDQANDLVSQIQLDPDERGFFKKIVSKKQTYPDYLKGSVTLISKNAKFDKKTNEWNILDKEKHILSSIEGEFTQFLKFDGNNYWEYNKDFPVFRRMAYTLPSDSTFREDLNCLKKKDEDTAQKLKVRLEEIQRNDKKLRESYAKENEKMKNKKK